jgi:hypothetical protein
MHHYYIYVGNNRNHLISGLKRKIVRDLIIYFNFTISLNKDPEHWKQLTQVEVLTEIYGKRKPYFVNASDDLNKWIRRRHGLLKM